MLIQKTNTEFRCVLCRCNRARILYLELYPITAHNATMTPVVLLWYGRNTFWFHFNLSIWTGICWQRSMIQSFVVCFVNVRILYLELYPITAHNATMTPVVLLWYGRNTFWIHFNLSIWTGNLLTEKYDTEFCCLFY